MCTRRISFTLELRPRSWPLSWGTRTAAPWSSSSTAGGTRRMRRLGRLRPLRSFDPLEESPPGDEELAAQHAADLVDAALAAPALVLHGLHVDAQQRRDLVA